MSLSREFHVHRSIRERYGFDRRVFSLRGNVLFPDLQSCRILTARMNARRRAAIPSASAVHTSDIYAMGLIEEIMHYMVSVYREQVVPGLGGKLLARLNERLPAAELDALLMRFVEEFPPRAVYAGELTASEFLERTVDGIPGREAALEEMLLLSLENANPAYRSFREFFDDSSLSDSSSYRVVLEEMRAFFETMPEFGPEKATLVETLEAPARNSPDSIEGQLRYMRDKWGHLIGRFLYRLLRSMDFLQEEQAFRGGPGGEPETYVYSYAEGEVGESERYSPDRFWMPNVVLLAKTTLVWLDQLTRAYGRDIRRLDEVPGEELDTIARRGFTGLWLIGLWERSPASRRIKNLCGNPEAEASAYSLYDYTIAESLGGWDALAVLRERCEQRGIRLASDMVPNHSGIDSKWVHEHPEWFLQLDYCPFPSYTFNGENLSSNPGVQIYLEDHYYERSDAAVVFKRTDSNGERFIYHGNDGTSMPWNDTAQLDYLNPEVREAVIETILHVARNFSIIRFDAAMTLAKKHIQRLWYPQPGSGGAIPSRAEHGLPQEEFDRHMPEEFWREVVDRVAEEVPDTLLLAEAFWMMESYFVRTLGMHRVYNSAFMNMLKNEENEKYRRTMKNTLEFDPQILKRFVNFMNNPDEETAVAQFGRGDKYFGVATLMLTMPGLPMFGHGQVEGYAEKYGMEYSRAYWDESPDEELIGRHDRELAPLARRRWLFAEVDEFELYDVYSEYGGVLESVFAYSNRAGDARALVLYNNAYDTVSGWIHTSCAINRGGQSTRSLGDALGVSNSHESFTIAREQRSGLWYLRNSAELHERGLSVDLHGYETQVFIDMYEVRDSADGHYRRLAEELGGRGVPSIETALKAQFLRPLHSRFDELVRSDAFARVDAVFEEKRSLAPVDRAALRHAYREFAESVSEFSGLGRRSEEAADRFVRMLAAFESFLELETKHGPVAGDRMPRPVAPERELMEHARRFVFAPFTGDRSAIESVLGFVILEPLSVLDETAAGAPDTILSYNAASIADDLMLSWRWQTLRECLGDSVRRGIDAALTLSRWYVDGRSLTEVIDAAMYEQTLCEFAGVNTYDSVDWFDRDSMRSLLWWLEVTAIVTWIADEVELGVARGTRVLEYATERQSAIAREAERSEASSTDRAPSDRPVSEEAQDRSREAPDRSREAADRSRETPERFRETQGGDDRKPLSSQESSAGAGHGTGPAVPDRPLDRERMSRPSPPLDEATAREAGRRLSQLHSEVAVPVQRAVEESGYRVDKLLELLGRGEDDATTASQ